MPLPLEEHVRQVLLENERGTHIFDAVKNGWAAFQDNYPQWKRV